jgi:hypothetical protein
MTLINARTTKLQRQIIGVRDFFEYNNTYFDNQNIYRVFSKLRRSF